MSWQRGVPLAEQDLDAHLGYVGSLFADGTLLAGGPLTEAAGRYVIAADDAGQAQAIAAADPGIVAGLFVAQVRGWLVIGRQPPRE